MALDSRLRGNDKVGGENGNDKVGGENGNDKVGGEKMAQRNIYLIMPVRNITAEEKQAIEDYVNYLEKQNHKVYCPLRDTDQNDDVGLRICSDNMRAMDKANEIHIWWNDKSQGSLFDLGIIFALITYVSDKKILIINDHDVRPTNRKSFTNLLLALSGGDRPSP